MDFEKDKILAQLDKIISDKLFSRSKINVRLLQFLVESTLNNTDVKETTIGTEFFGSKYDPIKSDNKVRVYIYHLRKKLEEYYNTSAKPDEIVFTIDKGQYKVGFEEYRETDTPPKAKNSWLYILGVFILVSAIAVLLYEKPINSFWKTLMNNYFSTTVIFGDYFTIATTVPTGGAGIIRDYNINSEEELQEYIDMHPEQDSQLKESPQRYFNWVAPYCSRSIAEFFGRHQYPFDITQISEWSVSQLEKENLVYFGQSKSMGVLKNILIENFPNYSFKNELIERTDPETNITTVYKDVVNYSDKITDYTIVARITMPAGNEMRFFLSDQDCGAISALQYFTQNDSVKAFYNRHHIANEEDF